MIELTRSLFGEANGGMCFLNYGGEGWDYILMVRSDEVEKYFSRRLLMWCEVRDGCV